MIQCPVLKAPCGEHAPQADYQFAYYWGPKDVGFKSTQHLGTPVYMAPEVLEARDRGAHHAYDPVAADFWAAGIWLCAVLIGSFPFDYQPGADVATAESQIQEQIRSTPWFESRFIRPYLDKMTPGCVILLHQMLEERPDRRITLEGVLSSLWMTKPLPPELEAAWQKLQAEQRAAASRMASIQVDEDLERRRNAVLQEVVMVAATAPGDVTTRAQLKLWTMTASRAGCAWTCACVRSLHPPTHPQPGACGRCTLNRPAPLRHASLWPPFGPRISTQSAANITFVSTKSNSTSESIRQSLLTRPLCFCTLGQQHCRGVEGGR